MRNLPNGYQEVERIGGTNFSNYVEQVYIDTGITTSNNIGAWTEMLHTATRDNVQWFTNTLPDNTVRRGLTTYPSGKWCPQWETWRQTDIAYNTDQFYDIKLNWNNNKECVIDGTTIYNCTNTTFSSNNTIRIGDISYNGYGWKCKFFKISDGITLVRDFVPCYRIADGVIGMYDLVNDVFYINPGTGTLIKGPDVLPPKKYIDRYYLNGEMYAIKFAGGGGGLPAEYQKIEYIESTGTQLIDTGYLITPNTEVSVDYQYTNAYSQDFVFGIGSDNDTSSGVTFCVYCSSLTFKAGISDGTDSSGTWENNLGNKDTNRHTFVLNNGTFSKYNSSGTLEDTTSTHFSITRTAEHSFGLFCWWRTDVNPARRENKTAAKLYGCTVKESGTLQRNFVPCYRIADSVIGLYDTVNSQFYTNDGTGSFIKGPDA